MARRQGAAGLGNDNTADYHKYRQAHNMLVNTLRFVGLKYYYEDRLPLFKLWLKIRKMRPTEHTRAVMDHIEWCIQLRTLGEEPPHKNNKYL